MKIKCPACSQILNIPDSAAGQIVKCPCGKQLRAPAAGTPTASAPAPGPAKNQPAKNQPATGGQQVPAKPSGNQPPKPGVKVAAPGNPGTATPKSASGPSDFDPAIFDELTKRDLKPVKGVANPYASTAAPTAGSGNLLKQYAPQGSLAKKELATVGSRIAGAILDGILNMVFVGIGAGIGLALVGSPGPNADVTQLLPLIAAIAVAGLIPAVINAVLIAKSGQTVGKKLMGIRIVDQTSGAQAGFVQGFLVRSVVFGFFTGIPLVGSFIAIADIVYLFIGNHQTLHDKLAKTIVVKA